MKNYSLHAIGAGACLSPLRGCIVELNGERIPEMVFFRLFGQYPARRPLKLGMVTLCPNCHYLAHYYLRQNKGEKFKQLTHLLNKLQEAPAKSPNL